MTELNERQKKFIGAVLSRKTDENKPVLEAVLKAYAINEGIIDKAKLAANKMLGKAKPAPKPETPKAAPAQKPVVHDYAALRRAMMFEPDCWDRDLRRFYANCELVQYYISNYGIRDFNTIVGSEAFRKAVDFGRTLDKMRVNPLVREDSRRKNMQECLERFYVGDNRVLVEGIMADFDESETVEFDLPPVFEAREDNISAFREAMAGIANFIRRHGFYPWAKFLKENRLLLARAGRFDKVEYPEAPERPSAKLAADIRNAYSAGTSED